METTRRTDRHLHSVLLSVMVLATASLAAGCVSATGLGLFMWGMSHYHRT
jgi:hypothetical protein